MDSSARITEIDVLLSVKTALLEFSEAVQMSLGEAKSEINRAHNWLQNDRVQYWKQQHRYRMNRLSDAKSELMRAEISSKETRSSAVVERKMVAKWKHQVEEAEQKLQNIKKWIRILDHQATLFRGKCQPLGRIVEGDLPKACVKLDRLMDTLEKYVRIAPPSGSAVTPARSSQAPDDAALGDDDASTTEKS